MSDDTKALVERLRRWYIEGGLMPARDAADTIERLRRDRDALAERCEKLREALRREVVGGRDEFVGCALCTGGWRIGEHERHAPGCLAAPKDAP